MEKKLRSMLPKMGFVLLMLALAACGKSNSSQEAAFTPLPPTEVGSTPDQTVRDFLSGLQQDNSGQSSLGFLSSDLQDDVESGHLLGTILAFEQEFKSFDVASPQYYDDGARATVLATLNEVSPIQRDFELQKINNAWLISSIVTYAVPTISIPPEEINVSHVILDYTWDLSHNDYKKAWSLLTQDAQTPLTEADIDRESQALQNLSVTSMTLLDRTPERQVFEATFWATPAQGQTSDWRAGSNTRWIEVLRTADGWRINQVDDTPIE